MPIFHLINDLASLRDYITTKLKPKSKFVLETLDLDDLIKIEPLTPQQSTDMEDVQGAKDVTILKKSTKPKSKISQNIGSTIYQELADTSKIIDVGTITEFLDEYKDNTHLLHELIKLLKQHSDRIKLIDQLLKDSKIDPNQIFEELTPLQLAIQKKAPKAIKALLAHSKINITLELKEIIELLKNFKSELQLSIIAKSLAGAFIGFTKKSHEMLDLEKQSEFFEQDIIIQKYPLHIAIALLKINPNFIKLIDQLILKTDVNLKINELTPLQLAINTEQIAVIIKLLNHPTIEIMDSDKKQILQLIIRKDNQQAFNDLLTKEKFLNFIKSNFTELLSYANHSNSPKLSAFIKQLIADNDNTSHRSITKKH